MLLCAYVNVDGLLHPKSEKKKKCMCFAHILPFHYGHGKCKRIVSINVLRELYMCHFSSVDSILCLLKTISKQCNSGAPTKKKRPNKLFIRDSDSIDVSI